jgi:hypothetical protein
METKIMNDVHFPNFIGNNQIMGHRKEEQVSLPFGFRAIKGHLR